MTDHRPRTGGLVTLASELATLAAKVRRARTAAADPPEPVGGAPPDLGPAEGEYTESADAEEVRGGRAAR